MQSQLPDAPWQPASPNDSIGKLHPVLARLTFLGNGAEIAAGGEWAHTLTILRYASIFRKKFEIIDG